MTYDGPARSGKQGGAARMGAFAAACAVAIAAIAGAVQISGSGDEKPKATVTAAPGSRKVGVLLVSHGSRSERWRTMLIDVEKSVRARVLSDGEVDDIRSAFMEYTEPSIATRLEEFDASGFTDVIVVPILLTVSSHSFDDIPTICGVKQDAATLATLKAEGIRVYAPRAKVHMTPLLDFPALLETNVVRRARLMVRDAGTDGVVLVGYGDEGYDSEWTRMMRRLGEAIERDLLIGTTVHAWCGHLVHYSKEPTIQAIREVLAKEQRALVIPVLVAVDETFQGRIIGGAVTDSGQLDRISYVGDAILPDADLDDWIVKVTSDARRALDDGTRHP